MQSSWLVGRNVFISIKKHTFSPPLLTCVVSPPPHFSPLGALGSILLQPFYFSHLAMAIVMFLLASQVPSNSF